MSNICGLCCYFNFTKSLARPRNFYQFVKLMEARGVMLVVVEFSLDGKYELTLPSPHILIQRTGGDLMWQKERLLNIGIYHLPKECEIVLVMDTDAILMGDNILERITKKLEYLSVVQCYSEVRHLHPSVKVDDVNLNDVGHPNNKYIYNEMGCMSGLHQIGNFQYGASGYAWAWRRDVLEKVRLFDHCIIGGGDKVTAGAMMQFRRTPYCAGINEKPYYEYRARIRQHLLPKDIGYLEGTVIYDMYHGSNLSKKYTERHKILNELYPFDSAIHLEGGLDTPWKFVSGFDQATQTRIKEYFVGRQDDQVHNVPFKTSPIVEW